MSIWGKPGEGIGLPLIAILCFGYLYLEQPLALIWNGRIDTYLNEGQVVTLVLAAALMLICFVWGWHRGLSRRASRRAAPVRWNPLQLWWFGFAGAVVGSVLMAYLVVRGGGFAQVFSAPHGRALPLEGVTAYVFLSPWWILSGTAMMVFAALRLPASWGRRLMIVAFVAVLSGLAILLSHRGLTFATAAALLVSYALGSKKRLTIARTTPIWLAAGLAVLLIVGYRTVLYLGEDRPEAPSLRHALTAGTSIDDTHASRRLTGNEFIYAAASVDTVNELQKYAMGIGWVYAYTFQLIPKTLWPGRPVFDYLGVNWDDIHSVTGIRIAGGSAQTIVADIYENFGPLSPLFFFLFGLLSGKLFMRARLSSSPLPVIAYAMFCSLSLNVFAQGFGTFLVPWPYSLAPMFLYHLHVRLSQTKLQGRNSARQLRSTWRVDLQWRGGLIALPPEEVRLARKRATP